MLTAGLLSFPLVEESLARSGSRVTMTILYDNHLFKEGLIAKNGFSCMIKGTEKTILFDTGGDADVLLHNCRRLGVNPLDIHTVVISHDHGDHTGGLLPFLTVNSDVSVFLPMGLWESLAQQVSISGAKVISVNRPTLICKGVYSSGMMGKTIPEQSLILNTRQGLIIICGCAHPGITNIIESAMRIFNKPVLFVFGGFHLKSASEQIIRETIKRFISYGVKKVGGSHCTGTRAMQLFKQTYGRNYIQMGVGKIIALQ